MNVVADSQAKSFRFEALPSKERLNLVAPSLDLTASDGTGLLLVSLSARVVVEDPLAFTELHLVFRNPEPRQLEGRFRIALPSGATISRFAMRIGTQWQEGEVVERQAARRAYEDFLHRRQDPALLEQEAGNEFSARVFPIEALDQKELIVSYSHELARPGEPYRLPLSGLPALGNLDIRALVGRSGAQPITSSLGGTATSWQVVEVRKSGWKPDGDFEVFPPASGRPGLRHGNLAVFRVLPELPAAPDELGSLLVLLDTSASRALGYRRQVELVETLVRGLAQGAGPAVPVAIACFDQRVELAFEGSAGNLSESEARKLAARPALGASDLVGALRWAAARTGPRYERVLVVTDGVATAGDIEPERLVEAVKSLGAAGVKRLDVLAVGGLRDDAALRRLATAGLERDGTVCEGDLTAPEIAARLTRATHSGIRVEVPGAAWVWPARLDGVQPGDAALIYADVPEGKPVRVLLGGAPTAGGELALEAVERPLIERAWIKARIEKLEEQRARAEGDADVREGLKKQIIDLSVKHRVLSPYTALLVLETEADYAQFHIDRRALADVLTVGPGGLEVLHRSVGSAPPAARNPAPSKPDFRAKEAQKLRAAPSPAADLDDDMVIGSASDAPDMEAAAEPEMALDMAMEREEGSAAPPMEAASFQDEELPEPMREEAPPETSRGPFLSAPAPAASRPAPSPARVPAPPPPAPASPLRRAIGAVANAVASIALPSSPVPQPVAAPPPPAAPPPAAQQQIDSWTGPFREVMELVLSGKGHAAFDRALTWRAESPGDVLALVALGEAAEATRDPVLAARAYGSLIDLYPSRADLRRFAGERLARLEAREALEVAIDTYRKAVESRPDHPSSHRLLGMALLRAGRPAEAFEAIAVGQARRYPDKFPGVDRILAEDLGLAAAAWIRAEPARRDEILGRLQRAGARLEDAPSVRFVLVWETDANDVDFHIHDARGGHAYYRDRTLPSGGELYADITQGYGPECFTIRNAPGERAYPYRLQAHYFRRGPMGYGMGALQIVEHDGAGGLVFEERPYVVMQDGAYVDLGVVTGPLRAAR